jgi:hypothetical protein
MQHNRSRIELIRVVVAIPLGLDTVASVDNEHNKSNNLQHHILLVVLIKAT